MPRPGARILAPCGKTCLGPRGKPGLCVNHPVTRVVLRLKVGDTHQHELRGSEEGGKSTYESWLRRNFSGPLWEPTEGLHQGLGQLHTSHVKEGDFRGFGGLLRCPINSQDELSAGDEAQKCQMNTSECGFQLFFFF